MSNTKLTKEEAIRLHRELWDWLSKNPDKHKGEWPGWEYNGGCNEAAWQDCFCCEFANDVTDEDGCVCKDCESCPLVWPITGVCCEPEEYDGEDEGLFTQWARSDADSKERTALAEQIRDLPVREDI